MQSGNAETTYLGGYTFCLWERWWWPGLGDSGHSGRRGRIREGFGRWSHGDSDRLDMCVKE